MHYKSSKYIPQICLCNIMRLKNIFKVFVNNNQTLDLNYSDVDKKKKIKIFNRKNLWQKFRVTYERGKIYIIYTMS